MIKAVIFDCFGVLTTDGWLPFKKKHFGTDQELHQQATDLNKQVDAGLIGFDDFMAGIAELAGITRSAASDAIESNVANIELFSYIRTSLSPSYKIGMLSNAGDDWLKTLFTEMERSVFDAVALSYATGYVKPDTRAYQDIAYKLDVHESECVFIDDQERYCKGAEDAGMKAVRYDNIDQCIVDLKALLQ